MTAHAGATNGAKSAASANSESELEDHQVQVKMTQWYHPRGLRSILRNMDAKGWATRHLDSVVAGILPVNFLR
jgi:hypothetical protein